MDKENCSNCQVGFLDKYVNIGSCPYFNPHDEAHCSMWKPLGEVKKVNSENKKLNMDDSNENR